ncbi:hypothetical protein GALL_107510 [mine drainage metagenome]|uniref:Uncharacterized protein n=1 Tax=mine drainage metagenome TaxID=410659 RepID=A0A1J5SFP5_9ZZZZ
MVVTHRWRVVNRDGLHFRAWDEECVAYDELSGNTHLLSSFAGEALAQLCREPAPRCAALLALDVAAQLALERDASLDQALAACLDEFERLGLAERSAD